ncbi:3-hydroxyacyl-CoA dehydrogenase NAD-binding domain-containing protein [Gammaproteobacteria bacterium]|nr:3-hydroxyacyl-CoA dehydrogenase NAD-binding domain-containing protein [Gammaproteobacteria bacterium]
MTITIKKVCFIGAGSMGCFNSLLASAAGYECVIYDPCEESLKNRASNQLKLVDFLNHENFFKGVDVKTAIKKIYDCSDLKLALDGADLISESIPENLKLKNELFQKLEGLVNKKTIITTNTSGLSLEALSNQINPKFQFAAMHFHLGSRLVDIVRGTHTSEETIISIKTFVETLGCGGIIYKNRNSKYALNSMLGALTTQSMLMVIEGRYSIEEIDEAWKNANDSKLGPFGVMDMLGLDVIKNAWEEQDEESRLIDHKEKILKHLSSYVHQNKLGIKTGEGFLNHSNINISNDQYNYENIKQDLYIGIIEASLVLLSDGILEKDAINNAWTYGTNLQKGPFDILDEIGIETFKKLYQEWVDLEYISNKSYELVSDVILNFK